MDLEVFINEIVEELRKRLGSGYLVSDQTIRKNNGVLYHAVSISDSSHKVSPCFCIENYYELYQKPEDIGLIAEDIIITYRKEKIPEVSFEWVKDKKQVLSQVLFRIVSTERNKMLLKNVPHYDMPELGFSALFYVMVDTGNGPNGTILLGDRHMEMLDVSEGELIESAWRNTPLAMEYTIINMDELLSDGCCEMACGAACPPQPFPVYVVTNKQKLFGAGCIVYPGILEKIAQKLGFDFYILPSSIHEVIVLPAESFEKDQAEALKMVVMEINQKELACEEVLTDSVYYYSREKQKLFLAA